jgi:HAD superfamily hydrolase (TIGR01509 family)
MDRPPTRISAVVFDIGETLRNDVGEFAAWADWLGVPQHTLSALIGAVRAKGGRTDDAFGYIRPGFDLQEELRLRSEAGVPECMSEVDLYADVRPTLKLLRSMGLWLAAAGNQSTRCGQLLDGLGLPLDAVYTSADWGVRKPHQEFFIRLAQAVPCPVAATLYVGDNWDHDIAPATRAGMKTAFLRRGPWGYLESNRIGDAQTPTFRLKALTELPELLEACCGPEELR